MVTKLTKTPELDQALSRDETVYFVDETGQPTHIVLPMEEARVFYEEYIRREVQKGIDQVERGECAPWDLQATRAEAHQRYAERHKTS